MTGRDAVRSLRDSGTLDQRPPTPQWLRTALFGIVMLALAGAGFYVFTFVLGSTHVARTVAPLPASTDLPTFGDVDKKLTPAQGGGPLSGHVTLLTSTPLSRDEIGHCTQIDIAAGKRAVSALHAKSGLPDTPYDYLIEQTAGTAADIACRAATRPIHLCSPEGRTDLVWTVEAQLGNMVDIEQRMGSADAPAATSAGLMGATPKQVAAFNLAFNDQLASAKQKTNDALKKAVAQGLMPVAAFYEDINFPSWRMDPFVKDAADAPTACQGQG